MNADEIKSKIQIEISPGPTPFTTKLRGSILFSYELNLANHDNRMYPPVIKEASDNIREAIVRQIFDDQTNEMAYAVCKFIQSHYPADPANSMKDQKRLMKAARYQPPK